MKYLQVDNEGNILSVAEPAEGFPFAAPENSVAVDATTEVDLQNQYWDKSTSSLLDRPQKPSNFYYWANKQWNLNSAQLLTAIKDIRTRKLMDSDWTQMPDSPLTTEQRTAWATYRQALRDLPANLTGNEIAIEDAPWPTPPTI